MLLCILTISHSVWEVDAISERGEVNGGIDGLICSDHSANDTVFDVSLNDTRPRLTCAYNDASLLNIPNCHDRTIYCTFPPKSIEHGSNEKYPNGTQKYKDGIRTVANPNPDGYLNPTSK